MNRIPLNEELLMQFNGEGIQHVALLTRTTCSPESLERDQVRRGVITVET